MAKYLTLPDGSSVPVPDEMSYDEAMAKAQTAYPDAFRPKEAPRTGIGAALSKGFEGLVSSGRTGIESLLGSPEEAAKRGMERGQAIGEKYGDQVSLEKVKKAYAERGVLPAAGEAVSQVPAALAEQAPNIAATVASARAGQKVGKFFGPAGQLVGAGVGAALPGLTQAFGSNIERQASEQQAAGKPVEISRTAAGAAAVPQAALDVAGTFIPLGGRLVSKLVGIPEQALISKSAAQVQKLADERLSATLAKGLGVGLLAEIPTEVAQQMLERAQAGLSLTSPDALKEYGETAYQVSLLAPLGAAGRVASRSGARSEIQQKQEDELSATRRQESEAEAGRLAEMKAREGTPEYALEVRQQLNDILAKRAELDKAANAKTEAGDMLGEQAKRDARAERKKLLDNDETKRLASEYNRLKGTGVYDQIAAQESAGKEKARVEGLSPMDYLLEGADTVSTKKTKAVEPDLEGYYEQQILSPGEAEKKAITGYAQQQIDLAKQQLPDPVIADYVEYLMADPLKAQDVLSNRTPVPGLTKRQNDALFGGLALQLKEYEKTRAAQGMRGTVAGQQRIAGLEAEEQTALEEQRAQAERDRAEARREQALGGEFAGLQRMKAAPAGLSDQFGLFGQPGQMPAGSAAIGQMQQKLSDEDVTYTAEEQKPRDLRRVPGAEFKLRGRAEGTGAPVTRDNLADRINRVLSTYDLSPEAVALLQRAEKALPQSGADYFDLLDQQLAKIESGEEGVPRKGQSRSLALQTMSPTEEQQARASTTAPTEAGPRQLQQITGARPGQAASGLKTPIEQPEAEDRRTGMRGAADVTKRVPDTLPTTLRGASVRALDLSMAAELAAPLRIQEEAAREDTGQKSLFPEEQEKLGAIKGNRGAFQMFMKSKFVQNLRQQLRRDELIAQRAQAIPALEKRANDLVSEIEDILKQYAEYRSADAIVQASKDVAQAKRDMAEIRAAASKSTVDRMLLAGAIEDLQQARKQVIEQGYGQGGVQELIADIDNINTQLQNAQSDMSLLDSALSVLDGQMQSFAAIQKLTTLIDKAPSVERIDQAKQELQAVRTELDVLQKENTDLQNRLRKDAADQRRADEAIKEVERKAQVEAGRVKPAEQMLNNLPLYDKATQYPALTEAQLLAREKGGTMPELSAVEQAKIDGDPAQVLGGYRARITELEKKIKNRQDETRVSLGKEMVAPAQARYDALNKAYKAAKSAAERDRLGPMRDTADALLQKAKSDLKAAPITWRGMKKDINDLADVINKEVWLEDLIDSGRIDMGAEAATVRAKPTEKEAAATRAEGVQAAAERTTAASTSGEPLTRSEVAKALKSQKTLFEGKGETGGAAKEIPMTPAERLAAMQKTAESRNKRLPQLAATNTGGPELTAPVDTEQSAAAIMQSIAKSTKDEINKAVAERLKMLLGNTEVRIVKDLRGDKDEAVSGTAASDGSFIELDRDFGMNEQTALHEGVHAATERVLSMPEDQLTESQLAAKKELRDIYEALKADKNMPYPELLDSLSEFAAESLTSPRLRVYMQSQPWTLKHMWDSFKSAILKLLGVKTPRNMSEAAIAAVDRLMTKVPRATEADFELAQPRLNQIRYANTTLAGAGAVADKTIAKQRGFMDDIKEAGAGLSFVTNMIDRFAPLEKLSKYMGDHKGLQMMYYLRMYDQRMNFVAQSVGEGALRVTEKTRADGKKERLIESAPGASLRGVVNILKDAAKLVGSPEGNSRLFSMYLIAKRAESVGLAKLNYGGKVTEADLQEVRRAIANTPGLKSIYDKAQQEYNLYNRDMLQFAVETGALSAKARAELIKNGDYVPYYRERNGGVEMMLGGQSIAQVGSVKEQPYLKELVGGEEPILDFMTSAVQNTNMLTDMSLRNLATKNAVFELQELGMATVGKGNATSGSNVVKFKVDGEDRFAMLDTDDITVNGKKYATGVPADLLVKGMEGIPLQNTIITKLMGGPARALRKFVVLNPLYAARQLFRDSLAAPLLSGADFAPVLGALKEVGSAAGKTLERRGITGGQVFTGTNEDLTAILRQISSGDSSLAQGIAKLEAISMTADALTRRAQYNSYIKQGLSEMEATYMALESMNFGKRGMNPAMHTLSTVIPFFNAQVQSLNVLYKAFTGNMPLNDKLKIREKMIQRGMMLAAMTMSYAALMQDEEEYKNATPEQKYGNWFIKLPGMEESLRIPIPFEIGYIFKAIPEAVVNIMMSPNGSEEAAKAFKQIALQTIPGGSSYGIPQAVKPLIEVGLGKSFYTGRDLESAHEQTLEPGQRARGTTTELARLIGEKINVSPIKIDALISGYFSTVGLALADTLSLALPTPERPVDATKRLSEMRVIGSMFQPKDASGIINATYDRMKDVREVKATYDDMLKKGRPADAQRYLQENMQDYALASTESSFSNYMQKIAKYEQAVRASDMSPDEKRRLLDDYKQLKIKYSTLVREAANKIAPR